MLNKRLYKSQKQYFNDYFCVLYAILENALTTNEKIIKSIKKSIKILKENVNQSKIFISAEKFRKRYGISDLAFFYIIFIIAKKIYPEKMFKFSGLTLKSFIIIIDKFRGFSERESNWLLDQL